MPVILECRENFSGILFIVTKQMSLKVILFVVIFSVETLISIPEDFIDIMTLQLIELDLRLWIPPERFSKKLETWSQIFLSEILYSVFTNVLYYENIINQQCATIKFWFGSCNTGDNLICSFMFTLITIKIGGHRKGQTQFVIFS